VNGPFCFSASRLCVRKFRFRALLASIHFDRGLRGFHGFQSPDPCRSRSVLTQRRKDAKAKDHVTAKGAKNAEVETERSRSVSSAWSAYSAVQLRAGLTADDSDGRECGDRRSHSPVRQAHPFGRLRMTLSGSRMGQGPAKSRGSRSRPPDHAGTPPSNAVAVPAAAIRLSRL
jgi:hypothetical protein